MDTPQGLEQFLAEQDKLEQHGSLKGQALTAAEGFGEGVLGPVAPMLETLAGVPPEDIRARKEVNPGVHTLGQIGGLTGSLMAGTGFGHALDMAGADALERVGLQAGEGALSKIGSAAAKNAVEGALFSASDEVSKLALGDPHQSLSTAAISIGLGGLIGGGAGAGIASVSPLWQATKSSAVGRVLGNLANKAGGIEGALPQAVDEAIGKLGVEASPEIRAALTDDPVLLQMAKTLEQSDTSSSGQAYQKSLKAFKEQVAQRVQQSIEPFGNKLPELSNAEAGKRIGTTLAKEIDERVSPLSKDFNRIKENFGPTPLAPDATSHMVEAISKLANDEGWLVSPSSDIAKAVNNIIEELPNVKNLKQLSDYIEAVGNATQKDPLNGSLKRAGGLLKDTLRGFESGIIEKEFADISPNLLNEFRAAQKAYRLESELKEAIDSRLHLRGATSSYAQRVKEMAITDSETLLRRISGKGDADLLQFLEKNYPRTAEELRKHHIDVLMDKAVSKAKPGEAINPGVLIKEVNKMEPELRNFAVPQLAQEQLNAASTILDKMAETPHNFSNTARTLDKLMAHIPGSAVGIASMAMGHNPAMALMFGYLAKALGKDAPDAMRLAMMKFAMTPRQVNPSAFKSAFEFMRHLVKGNEALTKAASAAVREGAEVVPMAMMPKEAAREDLKEALKVAENDPVSLIDKGAHIAHYLPDESTALGMLGARAVMYLQGLKPAEGESSPLGPKLPANSTAEDVYNRALDIAQQPLIVLHSIQQGTLTSQDVKTLVNVYPDLYARMQDKLLEQTIALKAKGETIPYRAILGLSTFAQMPLESSLTPQAIQLSQQAQMPQMGAPQQGQKGSPQKLNNISNMAQTPNQASEARQASAKA